MAVPVMRYLRKKYYNKADSPMLYYLKQEPGSGQMYNINTLAARIEANGSLTQEDVIHSIQSFVRHLREVLIEGNKVKVDGLGIFHITTSCTGSEKAEDCTVKSIRRVNLRFMVDSALRLVNDSIATTRSAPNNVSFYLKSESATTPGGDSGGSGDGGGEDPDA
ncbi:DNA-binding protein [uncultured Bacteroides sp.]|uniref:HU family DNA-binding protein n=1 Tax=uncultured Bacteroides sp. TaxID=162156 RepID=UPI002AA5E952|nr:DNA-binding protein [uncultured Bacteroides sp.]